MNASIRILDPICDMVVDLADATPVIDAGIREWYKSCRCCLSDAHPEVVKILDAEKATPTGP